MRNPYILLLILVIMAVAGCSSGVIASGTLEGHVDIGPLSPVVRVGVPEPTPSPEMYAAWQIVVLTPDGQKVIARVVIGPVGDYQVQLPAGDYMVRAQAINGGGLGNQQAVSAQIISEKTTRLDISIDTGIR